MSEPIWRGNPSAAPSWRDDVWGNLGRALYFGRLYVGYVTDRVSQPDGPWRAWITTKPPGWVGAYPTEQAAKDALLEAAWKALTDG